MKTVDMTKTAGDAGPLRGPMLTIASIAGFWGTSFMFIKIGAAAGLSALAIAAARGLLAAAVLGLWLLVRRSAADSSPDRARALIRDSLVLALFNGIVPNVLVALALQRIDSAPAAMIQASVPLLVMVLSITLLKAERLTPRQYMGLALGFIGVFTIIGPMAVMGGAASAGGTAAMLGAAASYAVTTVYLRQARPADIVLISFWQQVASGVVAAVLTWALVAVPIGSWALSPQIWAALFGLALFSTVVPMLMYFQLLRTVPAAQAALVQYLLPLAAMLYGVWLLGETLRVEAIAGGFLLLAGVYIATRSPRALPRSAT